MCFSELNKVDSQNVKLFLRMYILLSDEFAISFYRPTLRIFTQIGETTVQNIGQFSMSEILC